MDKYIVILSTVPDKETGLLVANALVKEKLAACVNIFSGIQSIYQWKGELCNEEELMLIIKSRSFLFEKIRKRISDLHSYEVPEIISIPVLEGHKPYLDWITSNT